MDIRKFNYPNYEPNLGNLTSKFRSEYINYYLNKGFLNNTSFDKINSLIASNDPKDPIFFWQLYSILGEEPIHILIKKFYENIFNDNDAPWFRDEFIDTGSIDFHVIGQKKFWLDVMGGGEHYIGGEKRLHIKHKLVENIMTKEGADRWMYNMEKTLNQLNLYFIQDKRVLPCIDNFLRYFMEKYSIEFDFNLYEIIKNKHKSCL